MVIRICTQIHFITHADNQKVYGKGLAMVCEIEFNNKTRPDSFLEPRFYAVKSIWYFFKYFFLHFERIKLVFKFYRITFMPITLLECFNRMLY